MMSIHIKRIVHLIIQFVISYSPSLYEFLSSVEHEIIFSRMMVIKEFMEAINFHSRNNYNYFTVTLLHWDYTFKY